MKAISPFQPLQTYRVEHGLVIHGEDWHQVPPNIADAQLHARQIFRAEYGFFVPTAEAIERVVQLLRRELGPTVRILDAGSGSGYLSKALCERGIGAFAVDCRDYENKNRKFGYPLATVHQRDALGNAVDYVKQGFDVVLLTWPPFGWTFAEDVLEAMLPGQWLIYEGEMKGGCCGTDGFFDTVTDTTKWERRIDLEHMLNEVHVNFLGLHDQWAVWRKLCTKSSGYSPIREIVTP